jgi:hypothetical protein
MGQSVGKARVAADASPLIGLTWAKVEQLHKRSTGERLAHSFTLNSDELEYVAGDGMLGSSNNNKIPPAKLLAIFDPEDYGVADRFEVVCVAIVCSMLTDEAKVNGIFDLFDFELTSTASFDAVLLAITSTLSGLAKVLEVEEPAEGDAEVQQTDSGLPPDKYLESMVQNMFTSAEVPLSRELPREAFLR